MPKPKIAVMLDENTSRGGTHYETHKDYFSAIDQAGGVPYGIPYLADMVDAVINEFDGFFFDRGRGLFSARVVSDRADIAFSTVGTHGDRSGDHARVFSGR
jgi:gamma-glutamyl-gamma-aminobutyrate hydrolase PuuD